MTECWEEQPHKRPTFQWLCSAVRRLLDDQQVNMHLHLVERLLHGLIFKLESKKFLFDLSVFALKLRINFLS